MVSDFLTKWFLISDNIVSDSQKHDFDLLLSWLCVFWNIFSQNLVVGKQKHFPRHDLRLSAKTEMILNQKDSQVVELVKIRNSFQKFLEQFLFLDKLLCCE